MSVIRRVPFLLASFLGSLFSASEKSEEVGRQRVVRLRRHVIALVALLNLGSLQGWPQEPPGGPTVRLAIEVTLPDGAVFYIPVVGDGEVPGIVPLPAGRFAGIRITPRMRTDSVQIEVSALTATKKKLSEAICDEVRSWNSEDAGSYNGDENASFMLWELSRLGLPALRVKVVPSHGPPPGGFHHPYAKSLAFCGCEYPKPQSITNPDGSSASGVAGTMSYPDAGRCVQISGCGQCCRTAVPASGQQASMRPDPGEYGGMGQGLDESGKRCGADGHTSLPRLVGVEVALVVGNAGAAEDQLTLTVLDATGQTVLGVTQNVQTADCDHVMFVIPKGGVEITPGQTYRLYGKIALRSRTRAPVSGFTTQFLAAGRISRNLWPS